MKDNTQGFFVIPRQETSKILPDDFETRYADLKSRWDLLRGRRMTLREKCSSILQDYIKGYGWRNHREECQSIHDELNNDGYDAETILSFFCNKVELYEHHVNYKQDGGFLRTLLFCRAVIEWEKTHADINLLDYFVKLYFKAFGW